jgi:hypothetical protein
VSSAWPSLCPWLSRWQTGLHTVLDTASSCHRRSFLRRASPTAWHEARIDPTAPQVWYTTALAYEDQTVSIHSHPQHGLSTGVMYLHALSRVRAGLRPVRTFRVRNDIDMASLNDDHVISWLALGDQCGTWLKHTVLHDVIINSNRS